MVILFWIISNMCIHERHLNVIYVLIKKKRKYMVQKLYCIVLLFILESLKWWVGGVVALFIVILKLYLLSSNIIIYLITKGEWVKQVYYGQKKNHRNSNTLGHWWNWRNPLSKIPTHLPVQQKTFGSHSVFHYRLFFFSLCVHSSKL